MALVRRRRMSTGRQTVHVVVANWRLAARSRKCRLLIPKRFASSRPSKTAPALPGGRKTYEPFGFRDGLAQPVIRGLRAEDGDNPKQARQDAGALYEDRLVDAGEFVLGYRNEYDELTYIPTSSIGRSAGHPSRRPFHAERKLPGGRQIEQNVEAFEALEEMNRRG